MDYVFTWRGTDACSPWANNYSHFTLLLPPLGPVEPSIATGTPQAGTLQGEGLTASCDWLPAGDTKAHHST